MKRNPGIIKLTSTNFEKDILKKKHKRKTNKKYMKTLPGTSGKM